METSPTGEKALPRRRKTMGGQQPGRHYFVGRRDILESLYDAMIDVTRARTLRVLCVHGCEGMGKTRLVAELLQILEGSGRPMRTTRIGFCDKAGRSILSTMIRSRFRLDEHEGDGPPAPRDRLDRLAMGLSELVPPKALDDAIRLLASVAGLLAGDGGQPLPGFDLELMRSASFRARADKTALNLIRYDAGVRPQVLVFDDWDRAANPRDPDVARALLKVLVDRPVMALLLSRTEVYETLQLPEPARVEAVPLPPLGDRDMERLVRGLLEKVEDLPDEIVASTVAKAAGIPIMGVELVRLLVHRGTIDAVPAPGRKSVRWVVRSEGFEPKSMPADVDSAARECFEGLDPAEQEIVAAAAVLGASFFVRAVVSLVRASPDRETAPVGSDRVGMKTEGTLMSLTDAGIFDMSEETTLRSQPAMRFANPALRELAYGMLEDTRRARFHRLAAQWIGCAEPTDRLAWLELRAAHLEKGGVPREASELCCQAGDLAAATSHPSQALELYRRGLALAGDDAAVAASAALDRLGRALLAAGEYDEAERSLLDLLHMATILDDETRIAQAHTLMGEVLRERGQYDRAEEHLDFALSLFETRKDQAGLADAKERMAWLLYQRGDKDAFHTASEHLEETLRLRRRLNDPLATARTMTTLGNVKYGMGELGRAISLHREALAIRERHDDKRGQVQTLSGLGCVRQDNGEPEEALVLWNRALALAEDIGDRAQQAAVRMSLAEERLLHGDHEQAEPLLREVLATASELGNARVRGIGLSLQSSLELARSQDAKALTVAEQALELGYEVDSRQIICMGLLAKGRALGHALFVDDPAAGEARHREADACFQKAIALMEAMGEMPTLVRALEAYGTFLTERGVANKGRRVLERADKLKVHMRTGKQKEDAIHEARTIRRTYPTTPVPGPQVPLVLDGLRKGRKKT